MKKIKKKLVTEKQLIEKAKKFMNNNPDLCKGVKSMYHVANLMAKFCFEINDLKESS